MAQSCLFPLSYPTVMVVLQAFIPYRAMCYYRWKGMACASVVPNRLGRQMDLGYILPTPQLDFSPQACGRLTQPLENPLRCYLPMRAVARTTWQRSRTSRQIAIYIFSTTPLLTLADQSTMPRCKWFALHLMA